ncbi:LAETG motif-containing sortase-dependent surface protein [Streptomyces sp. NPDC004065]|uniref:LAETG motif-containing sortase-dependent surface protein n=1 Tax=Streptomyces sp. NPDC004065 TaxID=3364689 RepID=UPI00385047C9
MKLRRAMVTAATTAVIAPLALLSAPVAFAEDGATTPTVTASESTPATSTSSSSAPESTPATTPETTPSGGTTAEATPSATASASTPAPKPTPTKSAEPTEEPTEPSGICEENEGYQSKLDARLVGLPGKIAVGSGWHPFTLSVSNPTKTDVKDVVFYAGVGPNDPSAENAFSTGQVQLQVKHDGVWENVTDGEGHSVGYLDLSDIGGGRTVDYQLRLNVKANAPVGAGLTIGGGLYFDEQENCIGSDEAHYILQIVKAGTDTTGTEPQEGGKVPLPSEKPNSTNTHDVTGSLAETGSSSVLPMIALVGGAAVVAGAGTVFAVRRRKAGANA